MAVFKVYIDLFNSIKKKKNREYKSSILPILPCYSSPLHIFAEEELKLACFK